MAHDIKALLLKLTDKSTSYLHNAAGLCVSRTNYEIAVEHFLLKAIEDSAGDMQTILRHFDVDIPKLITSITHSLEDFKSGNSGKPVFSPLLIDLFEKSWMTSSIDMTSNSISSGIIFLTFLEKPTFFGAGIYLDTIREINSEVLKKEFFKILKNSDEMRAIQKTGGAATGTQAKPSGSFLELYCQDFTKKASEGKIDPVFGREDEISQIIDIFARRRKNNPILVGEPGVGKTAVIEGLALRIIEKDVPDMLLNVRLLGLDMGALEAGAGMKGEFENRLKGVLDEVKASEKPVILFIDEAHTLIGAGGSAGTSDAANLLKPALARGEIRTCAATTWSEYKKYFEKDPALERRFQMVKLAEPDVKTATLILRGLKQSYEKAHGVIIRDDAIITAAEFADRYITARFLPDKAIDLIDTSSARVKINLSSRPYKITKLEKTIQALEREKDGIYRDHENGLDLDHERIKELEDKIESKKNELSAISDKWMKEKEKAYKIVETRNAMLNETDQDKKNSLKDEMKSYILDLKDFQGDDPLVKIEVDPDVVSKVVSDWTGIPLGKLQRDQAKTVLNMEELLNERVKGQNQGIALVSKVIKAAKSGIKDPIQPLGVFLLVGPSGVGKTETGLSLADLLFGGENNIVTINMSEFQEKHAVSRLIGSPPGYVGYGEGGMLSEAVRQNPYSVVLLDEVEKAHPDIMNLFYQVFDKGSLTDGEGKEINFSNTIIILTSNLASDVIAEMTIEEDMDIDIVTTAVRPMLSKYFKPALLARMTIVPYFSLNKEAMKNIVDLKLQKMKRNIFSNTKMNLTYSDKVVENIASRCTEVETGARNIDYILQGKIMPEISQNILAAMGEGDMPESVSIDMGEDENFKISFKH